MSREQSLLFWSLSIIITVLISFHVLFVISLHLIRRFILKDCKSKTESEIFRTIYGFSTMIFCWFAIFNIDLNTDGRSGGIGTNTISNCRKLLYASTIFETIIEWSLITFLLTKVKVSRNILSAIGITTSNKHIPMIILSNLLCIFYLITALSTLNSTLSKVYINGTFQCVRNLKVIAIIFHSLICILQIASSYLFLYPLFQIYKQSVIDSETACIDLNFDDSLDQIKDVLKQNTFWGSISILGQLIIITIWICFPQNGNTINIALFLITINFLIQNFVMVRLIGWHDIYGKYIKQCHAKKICYKSNQMNTNVSIRDIDDTDDYGYNPLHSDPVTPTVSVSTYHPPQIPQLVVH